METKPPPQSILRKYIAYVNIPFIICKHLFGKNHKHRHRVSVGIVIMVVGVAVSKAFADYLILHFICDIVGYMIHGIGVVPIVDLIIEQVQAEV